MSELRAPRVKGVEGSRIGVKNRLLAHSRCVGMTAGLSVGQQRKTGGAWMEHFYTLQHYNITPVNLALIGAYTLVDSYTPESPSLSTT